MSEKLLLIDGHSILHRAFYGLPDLTNAEGLHTGAVYGFLNILLKLTQEERPDYLAVAFDVHAPTFRHEIYAAYKGTRKPMPEELRQQVPLMKHVLDAMGIVRIEQAGLEADDLLGTLARRGEAAGMEVRLLSGDRDLLQIASERTMIVLPRTRGGQTVIDRYLAADVEAEYGVTPLQFIELKALMGDASDNIPGVPKVGEKTAKELMKAYGSIDGIYAHLADISKKSVRESLENNRALAELSKTLATIDTEAAFDFDFSAAAVHDFFTPAAYGEFKRLNFRNFLDRFGEAAVRADSLSTEVLRDPSAVSGAFEAACAALRNASGDVGFAFLRDASDGTMLGLALSWEENRAVFIPVREDITDDILRTEMETLSALAAENAAAGRDGRLSAYDLKRAYACFTPAAFAESGAEEADEEKLRAAQERSLFDILIAAYLLNPLKSDYQPEDIAGEYLQFVMQSAKERFGKTPWREAPEEALASYGGELAFVAQRAAPVLRKRLQEQEMLRLMEEIETPLSYILYDMERIGITARRDALAAYGERLIGRIDELEAAIHKAAGREFNINSPKQLGEILFEEMGLSGGKKTKTGYSTAADVLEKLAPEHRIVADILEYRGLTKLKSTYADGLIEYIGPDGRVHTTLHQTITATGRISSTDPNLQNIPMRTELGREIRKVFVPGEGCVFTDADYSQIELRILAHMSEDAALIAAYHEGKDIHRITAAKVFHKSFDEVTPLERRNAKAVNFGIVYGISAFGLAGDLSISRAEASGYMKQYFETYPGVKRYQERAVASAKERGYAVTLYGRRRPMPELKSGNFMQRSFGERVAMNAPIQGTAADIIKLAMLRVWRRLRAEGLRSRLILQIHDELLIEARAEERERVERLLTEEMTRAAQLSVPLEVDCHSGGDWYDAK